MPAETGPVYLPTVLSLRLVGGQEGVESELGRGAMTGVGDAVAACGPPAAVTAPYPVVRYSRLGCRCLRPWRHRGWSRLDSRLGHRLIGRAGGEIGRGGSEGGSGDCWRDTCWAGGKASLEQRHKARRKSS